MPTRQKKYLLKSYFLMVLATMLGAWGPPISKKIVETMDIEIAVFLMLLMGSIFLFFTQIYIDFTNDKDEDKDKIPQKKQILKFCMMISLCGISQGACYYLYILAMNLKSVTEVVIFTRITPLFIVFLSVFMLQEKIKSVPKLLIATGLCFSGICCLQGFDLNIKSIRFICLATIIALSSAFPDVYRVCIKRNFTIKSSYIVAASMFMGSTFTFSILLVIDKPFDIPSYFELLLVTFAGFFTIALPCLLMIKAYDLSKNLGKIISITYTMPIFSAVYAYILFAEKNFNYFQLSIALVLIFSGISIANYQITKKI